jgi:hypothetical protein
VTGKGLACACSQEPKPRAPHKKTDRRCGYLRPQCCLPPWCGYLAPEARRPWTRSHNPRAVGNRFSHGADAPCAQQDLPPAHAHSPASLVSATIATRTAKRLMRVHDSGRPGCICDAPCIILDLEIHIFRADDPKIAEAEVGHGPSHLMQGHKHNSARSHSRAAQLAPTHPRRNSECTWPTFPGYIGFSRTNRTLRSFSST